MNVPRKNFAGPPVQDTSDVGQALCGLQEVTQGMVELFRGQHEIQRRQLDQPGNAGGSDRRAQTWLKACPVFNGKNPDEYFEWIAKVELVAQWAADPEE